MDLIYNIRMIRHGTMVFVLLTLMLAPAAVAEEKANAPRMKIEWIGMHRDDLIKLLGEPVKVKKSDEGEILVFNGPPEWFADPTDPKRRPGQVIIKSGKGHPIMVGGRTTTPAASPADDHEIITDSEGNAVGAYGEALTAPGTGVVTVRKMKFFLDDKGCVRRIKVGKRVAK